MWVSHNYANTAGVKGKSRLLDADLYGPSQIIFGEKTAPKGDGSIIVPVMENGVKMVSMDLRTSVVRHLS